MSAAVLELDRIEVGHARSEPLLTDWSSSFAAGEIIAITGPSGRGKSTLLSVVGLLLRPRAGRVTIGADDVTNWSDRKRARLRAARFGFVFQDALLDDRRTILDNVLEPALYNGTQRREAGTRALELLERFDVTLPPRRRPGQVSGGQAQRIALCRALLGDPPILVADEPTGNLDRVTADTVVDAFIEHAAGGGTVVIATHDPLVVSRCHRVVGL